MSRYQRDTGYQAFRILQIAFVLGPVLAGLDKFLYILTNWEQYLSPLVTQTLSLEAKTVMMIVGAIEIIVGLLVWWKPQIFAYIVALWLLLIIINLLILGGYFDIALRDFALMLSALALGRLSHKYVT